MIIWQIGNGMKPNLAQTGMGKEISVSFDKKYIERYSVMIPKPMHDFKLGFIAACFSFFGCIKFWVSTERDQHVEC